MTELVQTPNCTAVTYLSTAGYSRSNKVLVLTPVRRRFPSLDHTRLLQWLPLGRGGGRSPDSRSVVHRVGGIDTIQRGTAQLRRTSHTQQN